MICPTRVWCVLVTGLLFCSATVSGGSKKDSLLRIVSVNGGSDSTYCELIWQYVFNQPDSAIYFGKKGLEWADKRDIVRWKGTILNRMGVAYDIKSMPDSALYFYEQALDYGKKTENKVTIAGALNNKGLIYWNQGATDKAIENYIASAEIFEEIDNLKGLGNTYNNIGLIEYEEGQLERSITYHHKALAVRKKVNDEYGIAASYSNLAQSYGIKTMNLDSAIYYLELAIPIKQKLNDQYGLARSYNNLGDIYAILERLELAKDYLNRALSIQLELGNAEGYASSYYNIADIYRRSKEPQTQLAYLDSAEGSATAHNDFSLLWKIYRAKARSLGRMGKFGKAHEYWLAFDHVKDSIITKQRSNKIQELETRYRTAEKDRELAERKAALAEKNLLIENRNKWVAGLAGLTVSVLLLAFAGVQINRRRSQAEKDAAIISERERGLKAVINATENERKRIAKDLHDGIVQSLTGLSLRFQKLTAPSSGFSHSQKQEMNESKQMLDDSISELRTISHQMMPRALSELGLVPAIEDMLGKSLGNTNIKYEFEELRVGKERFDESIEISLYRICQELINNIIKHSKAEAVSIQLLKTKSHLVLVVEDNGTGFDTSNPKIENGIGLMNITSRAKAINGEFNYEPSPGQGTVATIRIPLK